MFEQERLKALLRMHLESFNFMISQGLKFVISDFIVNKKFYEMITLGYDFELLDLFIGKPMLNTVQKKIRIIPRQMRDLLDTYAGKMFFIFSIKFRNSFSKRFLVQCGDFPIMINSIKCHLNNLHPNQKIELDEEESEGGGFFVVNGSEKLIRLIIVPKKNVAQIYSRLSNSLKGFKFSILSCSFRSVARTQVSKTIHLHYLSDGSIMLRVVINRQEFSLPILLVLRALVDYNNKLFFGSLFDLGLNNSYIRKRILKMVRDSYKICPQMNQESALKKIGQIFSKLFPGIKRNWYTTSLYFLNRIVLVHLGDNFSLKFILLRHMILKIFQVQKGISTEDNPDSFLCQEVLLPGNLFLGLIRNKLGIEIKKLRYLINCFLTKKKFISFSNLEKLSSKYFGFIFNSIGSLIKKFITTGNISKDLEYECKENNGFSLIADRQNIFKEIALFRSIHRGASFIESKNTEFRKISGSSWGFLCPVQTPDGKLCGVLNHFSMSALSTFHNPFELSVIRRYFKRFRVGNNLNKKNPALVEILFDGIFCSYLPEKEGRLFFDMLKIEKCHSLGKLPISTEIFFIPRSNSNSGSNVFMLNSHDSRLARPVRWRQRERETTINVPRNNNLWVGYEKNIELINPLEQEIIEIENQSNYKLPTKDKPLLPSHHEIDGLSILSLIGGATPFSDYNQSPRNIYQCQMAKQSVAVPFLTHWRRSDSKSLFLITPQSPVCRNKISYEGLNLDLKGIGFNSIVSILTYSGFDMEDAIVMSRSSIERGFSRALITETSLIETDYKFLLQRKKDACVIKPRNKFSHIDVDGHLFKNSSIMVDSDYSEDLKGKKSILRYNNPFPGAISQVKISGCSKMGKMGVNGQIKIRTVQKPKIGDKFASRHGQKGVLSYLFDQNDLPFSENGIIPDIIFNPHGIPSRMTIGLLMESISSKSSIYLGLFSDSSPFQNYRKKLVYNKIGRFLRNNGLNYIGDEIFYSGYTGEPLSKPVFTGLIHYQRLKHMVSDKFQASKNSPKNIITRQPTKGRKSGGSIRFGEMERDALLGHGCSFLLHDRLQKSSDLHSTLLNCKTGGFQNYEKGLEKKNIFDTETLQSNEKKILIPYVVKSLLAELSCINIKITIHA